MADQGGLPVAALGQALGATGMLSDASALDTGETFRFVRGPSPLDGQRITRFALGISVRFKCERHGYGDTLGRALRVGHMLYGAGSFCLLEGFGEVPLGHMVAGLDKVVSWSDFDWIEQDEKKQNGPLRMAPTNIRIENSFQDAAGNLFFLRAIACVEGSELSDLIPSVPRSIDPPMYLFGSPKDAKAFFDLHAATRGELSELPKLAARLELFGAVDKLIDGRSPDDLDMFELADVGRLLAQLDATAFALIDDLPTRKLYLEMLVEAWTFEEHEKAIVELFKSVPNGDQLDELLTGDLKTRLVTDLDKELWSMLGVVGRRFGRSDPLGWQEFSTILLNLVPGFNIVAFEGYDPDGWPKLRFDVLDEFYIAAEKLFVDIPSDLVEGLWLLVTQPQNLVEGVFQLAKMALASQLANLGVDWAQKYMNDLLTGLGGRIRDGLRGAERLELTGRLVDQVKWSVVWEVVSWFVGVGEVRAALGAHKTARAFIDAAAATSRLAKLGDVGDNAAHVAKLRKLGQIMGAEKKLADANDGARLLGLLPEEDIARLADEVESVSLDNVNKFDDLAGHPQLLEAVQRAADKVDVIRELERVLGALDEGARKGAQKLRTLDWYPDNFVGEEDFLADIRKLTGAVDGELIPPANLEAFFRAVDKMPLDVFENRTRNVAFFLELAREPGAKSSQFIVRNGYEAFAKLYDRSNESLAAVKGYSQALETMVEKSAQADKPAEWNRLVQKVVDGDQEVLGKLDNLRPKRGGQAGYMPSPDEEKLLRKMGVVEFIEKSQSVNPGKRGLIFEEVSFPATLAEFTGTSTTTRQRLLVELADNADLGKYAHPDVVEKLADRTRFFTDSCIVEADGVWLVDTKGFFGKSRVDGLQLDFYEAMHKQGTITGYLGDAATPQALKVKGILYVFPEVGGAKINATAVFGRRGTVWYFDKSGKIVKLKPPTP